MIYVSTPEGLLFISCKREENVLFESECTFTSSPLTIAEGGGGGVETD